jgi:hypothetical protein
MSDYAALNDSRYTNTILDNEVSPYDEGWADGSAGDKPDSHLQGRLDYRQGYVRGLVANMREIADRQRNYVDPSTGFDWF